MLTEEDKRQGPLAPAIMHAVQVGVWRTNYRADNRLTGLLKLAEEHHPAGTVMVNRWLETSGIGVPEAQVGE